MQYREIVACETLKVSRYVHCASQQVSRKGRQYLQSQRLCRFLGEYPNCTAIHRTPWMQHRTYKRLLNRLRQLEARSPDMRRRKRKAKPFNRTMLRPVTMYKTRIASIAMA